MFQLPDFSIFFQNTSGKRSRRRTEKRCCSDRYIAQCWPIFKHKATERQSYQPWQIPSAGGIAELLCPWKCGSLHSNPSGTCRYGIASRCGKKRKRTCEIGIATAVGCYTFGGQEDHGKKTKTGIIHDRLVGKCGTWLRGSYFHGSEGFCSSVLPDQTLMFADDC